MATTLGKVLEEEAAALLQARQGSGKVMEEETAALQQARQGSGKVLSVSRLLTRDSSAGAAPSFRVYYGVASAGAVPFLWESQPGTPKKDAASDATMPPLTPPPSYYAAAKEDARNRNGGGGAGKKVGILGFILPRFSMARRRTRPSGSPTSSFSSASSSSSSASSTFSSFCGTQSPACSSMRGGGSSRIPAPPSSSSIRGRGYGSSRKHASSAASFSDEEDTSAALACFGVRAESFRAFKGCRVAVTVRSALGSSVGGGHTAAGQVHSVKAN